MEGFITSEYPLDQVQEEKNIVEILKSLGVLIRIINPTDIRLSRMFFFDHFQGYL